MGYTPPFLDVRKVAGAYKVYAPSSATTDDLWIYPNTTDVETYILINGGAGMFLSVKAGQAIGLYDYTAGEMLNIKHTTPDIILTVLNNKNLWLKPQGTGLVKFGDYTAGAATDSTGYITILDAAGNTRKLMVQA